MAVQCEGCRTCGGAGSFDESCLDNYEISEEETSEDEVSNL